ncbi:sensor histidine kinase [Kitasatospora camelliae]|uniref:histidine kinase n=1 Tax=Kitasatospora camelliae TaxID=3156397 RepID=A0AAU8K4Y0_9ACTN
MSPIPAKLLRRALPGPWTTRRTLRECGAALALGLLAAGLEALGTFHAGQTALVGLAVTALYLLRRGLPGPVLVLAAAGAGWPAGFLPALVFAGFSAGRRIARPVLLGAVFSVAFLALCGVAVQKEGGEVPLRAFALGLAVGFLVLAVLPAVFGRYRAQRRALHTERTAHLHRERVMIAHQARLRERHRIAQDMHDSLGHQLALIAVHTGALEVDRTLTERQREAVSVLRQAATGAMRELREVVGLLRDDTLPEAGGADAVERLADASRAAGTEVALRQDGEIRPLAAATGHAAYRIVQEGLTNAHKHAPTAPIAVVLRYEPDTLVVEVVNGPAPDAAPAVSGGQGLTGLRERARLLGGIVHAGPTPDGGYRLAGLLPYDTARGPAGDEPELDTLPADAAPSRRRRPALGCALGAGIVVLTSIAVMVWGGITFVQSLDDATISKSRYDSLEVGRPESEIQDQLPPGSDFFSGELRKHGPPVPPGASCRWFITDGGDDAGGGTSGGGDGDWAARFCFRDGLLIEKQHYRANV